VAPRAARRERAAGVDALDQELPLADITEVG